MDLVLVVIGLIAAGGSVLVGLIISRGIVKPVTVMVGVARQIAAGDVSQKIELHSTDEIGQLADAFRTMIVSLQNIAGTAKKMAARDLTQEVNPQSGQDVLGVAFKDMKFTRHGGAGAEQRRKPGCCIPGVGSKSQLCCSRGRRYVLKHDIRRGLDGTGLHQSPFRGERHRGNDLDHR